MCDVRTYICFILINQQKVFKIKRSLRQDICWAPGIYIQSAEISIEKVVMILPLPTDNTLQNTSTEYTPNAC